MTKVVDDDFRVACSVPSPIMLQHYTIPLRRHEPQVIADRYEEMLKLLALYPELTVFYNGAHCGASVTGILAHAPAGSGRRAVANTETLAATV